MPMETVQSHERVMNILIGRIFSRELKPGDKLPPERLLAKEMDVDRASLRVGLKHLETMNVLTIRQGDGIYVRDYLAGASLDFLRVLFLQAQEPESEWLVDRFILDEVWEFWIAFFPDMLKLASKRFTLRDLKAMMDILDTELANLDDQEMLVELELQTQELVAQVANNIVFLLFSHTCRPLRKKMIEIFFHSIDTADIKQHVETKKTLTRAFMTTSGEGGDAIIEQYRVVLGEYRQRLRRILFQEPVEASQNR